MTIAQCIFFVAVPAHVGNVARDFAGTDQSDRRFAAIFAAQRDARRPLRSAQSGCMIIPSKARAADLHLLACG